MSPILQGAIIGAVGGLIGVFVVNSSKKNKFNSIRKTVTDPNVEYMGDFHIASASRYGKSMKFFDSFGALYLIGNMLYYKSAVTATPLMFNLKECTVQQEPNWRMLKWFSVTTPVGEKYYFNSYKMGAVTNNSDETYRAMEIFKKKTATA
jgi:hypothetical protein